MSNNLNEEPYPSKPAEPTSEVDPTPGAKKPTSQRKIDANRQNSRKSTGPRTRMGKDKSRGNSLKFGIFATDKILFEHILSPEDRQWFDEFLERLIEEEKLATAFESVVLRNYALANLHRELLDRAEYAGMLKRTSESLRAYQTITLEKLMSSGGKELLGKKKVLYDIMNSESVKSLSDEEKAEIFRNVKTALLGADFLPNEQEFTLQESRRASVRRESNAAFKQFMALRYRRQTQPARPVEKAARDPYRGSQEEKVENEATQVDENPGLDRRPLLQQLMEGMGVEYKPFNADRN